MLPERLDGLRVLDIGAWDGFFSFEAERRGAQVVAMDLLAWQRGPRSGRPCFELAREALGSKVEDVTCDVMELDPERVGSFDLVLCLGVLYHLRDPWEALARISSVTRDMLVLETHVDASTFSRPAMVLYPGAELNDDASNWWGPNESALLALLADVGFTERSVRYREPLTKRALRAVSRARRAPLLSSLQQGRVVVHGHKGQA
jgi:tRNA (mo5U34)-methyltransferase